MNDIERALLKAQLATDTIWCFQCGQYGKCTRAACRYRVGVTDITVPACAHCLQQAMSDGIDVTDSSPVTQPPHIELLERLTQ